MEERKKYMKNGQRWKENFKIEKLELNCMSIR